MPPDDDKPCKPYRTMCKHMQLLVISWPMLVMLSHPPLNVLSLYSSPSLYPPREPRPDQSEWLSTSPLEPKKKKKTNPGGFCSPTASPATTASSPKWCLPSTWWHSPIMPEPSTYWGLFSNDSPFSYHKTPHIPKSDQDAAFFDQFTLVEQYRWYVLEAKKRRARRRR